MNFERIQEVIKEYQNETTAPLGIAFCDLESGAECGLNGDMQFPIASTFKIFVLLEIFRMVERGELSLDQKYRLEKSDIAPGSGILHNFQLGCELTLYDYCYMMMALSDNTATDIMMKFATPEKIREDILKPYGFAGTKIDLTCSDLILNYYMVSEAPNGEKQPNGKKSFRNAPYFCGLSEKDNSSTPNEMLRCMNMIYRGEFLTEESTKQLLGIMKKCITNQRLPKKLPENVAVAHKTGSLDRCVNDIGVVYTTKGAYSIGIYYNGSLADAEEYNNNTKYRTGEDLLARISKDVFDAYME